MAGVSVSAVESGQGVSARMEPVSSSARAGRQRRWWRFVLLVVVAVVGVIVLRATVLAPDPLEVQVERVTRGTVEETVTNTRAGTATARLRSGLSPQVGGRVVAFAVSRRGVGGGRRPAGPAGRRDRPISARAGPPDVSTTAAQAEEACLAADLAVSELRRIEALHGRGYASEQAFETSDSEQRRTEAACRAARAAAEQARRGSGWRSRSWSSPRSGRRSRASWPRSPPRWGEWITPSPPAMAVPPGD